MYKPPPVWKTALLLMTIGTFCALTKQPTMATVLFTGGFVILAVAEVGVWIVEEIRRGSD